jgi:predicted S18 family serine protease
MKRLVLRLSVICLAVLLISTAIIASDQPAQSPVESNQSANAIAVADSSSGMGLEIALACIVLGGGMVFLFRPKRRVTTA